MASIFTKIVNGEIPSYKVAEDNAFYAFLDINPLKEGHTLVIPKVEIDYIFDLESDHFASLFKFAQRVAVAIKESIPCNRVAIAVLGLEVPHAHIHLIPIESERDLNFGNPKLKLEPHRMEQIALSISSKII
ncbi:MAG: HIT domain-containing protein [Bacteroidales bacterium]